MFGYWLFPKQVFENYYQNRVLFNNIFLIVFSCFYLFSNGYFKKQLYKYGEW